MVKEKRKTRLDKGGTTEFIGFGAFSAAAPHSTLPVTRSPSSLSHHSSASGTTLAWTPVYAGADAGVQTAFSWLTSKRDPTTHVKALQALAAYIANPDISKRLQILVVQHWIWLYHRKVYLDSRPAVRAAALHVWIQIRRRLPKAFGTLLEQTTDPMVVLGMLYSARVDAAAEVQQVVREARTQEVLFAGLSDDDSDETTGEEDKVSRVDWETGILALADSILSCGRVSIFYERFLQGKRSTQMSPYSDLGEDQKDLVLETYLRVTGCALDSLVLFIREHASPAQLTVNTAVWYKALTTSHASLRRRTYALVAAVATRGLASSGLPSLTQTLASEKEPSNWPTLVECLLACTQASGEPLSATYAGPITKAWKKALYGASMASAGPTLLPLMALMDTPSQAWKLLKAAWDGRELTLGGRERWRLVQAVAESLVFGLLRKQSEAEVLSVYTMEWVDLYGQVIREALCTDPSKLVGTSVPAHEEVLKNLGQQLPRLETVLAQSRTDTVTLSNALDFLEQQNSGITLATVLLPVLSKDGKKESALSSRLLSSLLAHSKGLCENDDSPFIPIFRNLFGELCPRGTSGGVPSSDDYDAMVILMDTIKCCRLFDPERSMEKFIMNDLLRWSIIHTSSLAVGHTQNRALVQSDFRLLYRCLDSLNDLGRQQKLWEPFLRELISAKCTLEWLGLGLTTLVKQNSEAAVWIRCVTLDNFLRGRAHEVPALSEDDLSQGSGDSEEERHVLDFLLICCGLSRECGTRLIDKDVVRAWVNELSGASRAYGSRSSPVERVLLRIVSTTQSCALSDDEQDEVLLRVWCQGCQIIADGLVDCLGKEAALRSRFVATASSYLRDDASTIVSSHSALREDAVRVWSIRAHDLLRVCKTAVGEDVASPSFTMLGLSRKDDWISNAPVMFDLSMALFDHVPDDAERFSLLSNSTDVTTMDLVVSILVAVSEASTDSVSASRVSHGKDRCGQFLCAIGGVSLDHGHVQLWTSETVRRAESLCQTTDNGKDQQICCHIAVISQLVGIVFQRISPRSTPELSTDSVKAGDELWYIPDPENPDDRVAIKVMKAHFDAEAGYYFSISVDKEGQLQERQTVISRLRQHAQDSSTDDCVDPKKIPEDEWKQRHETRDLLVQRLVLPFFSILSWKCCMAELVCVATAQIGLGSSRGLGSQHYDIFRMIQGEVESLSTAMDNGDALQVEASLWKLSLAFGFGLNVPPCDWIQTEFNVDPMAMLDQVCSGFLQSSDNVAPAESAALSLFSTLLRGIRRTKGALSIPSTVAALVIGLTEKKAKASVSDGYTDQTMLALLALNQTLPFAPESDNTSESACSTVAKLIRAFATSWNSDTSNQTKLIQLDHYAPFQELIRALQTKDSLSSMLKASASEAAEELVACLFYPSKRHTAFQLLEIASDRSTPLREEKHIILAKSTERHAKEWTEGLSSEESDDLIQDVEVVSQWVPLSCMEEVEKWHDEDFGSMNEDETIGRFLVWLNLLRTVDAAAPLDFRNRPAFVSYLRMAGSSNSVLNRAILFDRYINNPKATKNVPSIDPNTALLDPSDLTLEKLSALVLFRSIEVLPSLCRRWWEEECPRVYVGPVQSIVETSVAPSILGRELRRIRGSTDGFGEMNVSASSATRQVTATYIQDDFTLKVLIQLPSSFPLRSAEVDCSKTLGVPQTRWKRWSLQITQMLNNQGGTLQDALLLWKNNVDKEFEGVEPCPVCYSVLHVKTHKLPALECTTCHNRFHADCLNQWFRSSGKSQCVLCQQDWRGTRVA
jgi:hypothetical protein